MRRSLRSQILQPMLGVMLVTTICVSIVNAWVAARRTRLHIEHQLREVAQTLAEASFPLTDAVLRQTRGLSGAEFALSDARGRILAASRPDLAVRRVQETPVPQTPAELQLDRTVAFGGARYFHATVQRAPRWSVGEDEQLHIFYPEQQWRRSWREAVAPPLIVGVVALAVMAGLATWVAARLAQPIRDLRSHVEGIAQGGFQPVAIPARDDEIGDLAAAVNRMAEMLARYEEEIRRRERLRTLGQLGGGIAHQMRNAATGCRMALDLHRRQAPPGEDDENLAVAVRQLELMETYLRRFLTLGAEHVSPSARVDLVCVIEDVLPLVRPTAGHLHVALRWSPPPAPVWVRGDENGLSQLVVNLTLNAIEAASSYRSQAEPDSGAWVEVRISPDPVESRARLEVLDSGPGPAPQVRHRIFEPLVTDKPDGAGLGLPVVREIAQLHGGVAAWERQDGRTCFYVELPVLQGDKQRVATVGG